MLVEEVYSWDKITPEKSLAEEWSWVCSKEVPFTVLFFSVENGIIVTVTERCTELMKWAFKSLILFSQINAIEIFFFPKKKLDVVGKIKQDVVSNDIDRWLVKGFSKNGACGSVFLVL